MKVAINFANPITRDIKSKGGSPFRGMSTLIKDTKDLQDGHENQRFSGLLKMPSIFMSNPTERRFFERSPYIDRTLKKLINTPETNTHMIKNAFCKANKEGLLFIILLFLISIIFLHSILSSSKIMNNIHHINDITFISYNLRESLFGYKDLHLWTPYYYSGQPLYAQPEYYFLDLNFLYLLLFRNIIISMNLATITYFFLAGLGVYLLFLTFKDDKKGAFIASIIYMFSGYMHSFVIIGNINVLAGYSLIPFAFMLFVKALKSKNFAANSIFSGLFIALQIFSGGTLLIPYELVLFGIYAFFYLFGKDINKRIMKLAVVGTIVVLVGFGISAVKLLPGIEFLNLSNRAAGINYQEYLGHPAELSNIMHILITNLFSSEISASIGFMGFLLLMFSLYNFKKRYVIFSLLVIMFSILMAIKGPVADLFYQLPVFGQLRHIERALFLTALASSILAGSGYAVFLEKINKIAKINKNIIFSVVILLILTELLLLQNFPVSVKAIKPEEIPINNYISQDTSRFRTINLALSTLVGASGYNYLAQLGIGTIKGGSGIWFNDYLAYLSIAQQTNPAKLWGMLNNKYVISDKELSISGLRFIDKFDICEKCDIREVSGPYLYENIEFMPRAYYVDKSILAIGKKENSNQIIYSLILNNNFDPKKIVIIQGREFVSDYDISELKKYDVVIISESVNSNDIELLKNYVDGGGILLPDIFSNKNSIDQEEIQNLFNELDGKFDEIKILEYENNKATYDVERKKGFLVLGERFSNFPGWEALGKNKKEILRANGIATAVALENDEKITFKYKPASFRKGLLITLLTSVFIVVFLTSSYIKKHGKNKS